MSRISDTMLMTYVDRCLPPAEAALVEQYLATNERAFRLVELLSRLCVLTRVAFEPPVNSAAQDRLVAAIDAAAPPNVHFWRTGLSAWFGLWNWKA